MIMKTLTNALLMLSALVCLTVTANANSLDEKNKKGTVDYTLNKYIEATTQGQSEDFHQYLDETFKIGINHGRKANRYSKQQFMKDLKDQKNVVLDCKSTFTVVEQSDNCALARIVMKYPTFTKINYVNMCNTSDGWKITDISNT